MDGALDAAMNRPHIYGSEAECEASLARYIARGRKLLDEAVGVRKRVVGLVGTDFARDAPTIETDWARGFGNGSRTLARG